MVLRENTLIEKCEEGRRRRRSSRFICVDKDMEANEHKLLLMQMSAIMLIEGVASMYKLCHC